ncbi:hypothetical protein B5J93_01705 [Moraxella equi]|uniref:L,D-TPase catalytic domain-containing protein n=2 Tax=Moraxella equi TaxID=60442 RepID=A0ABX3NL76_9GAMM|nr:hypothetical protein B5J93_01705 [Moraxella equi]
MRFTMFYFKKSCSKKLTTLALSTLAICGTTAFAQLDVKTTQSGTKNTFDPTLLTTDDSDTTSQIDTKKTSSDTATIKSLEKSGKRYTKVDLSEYAKTVNESTWSPNMKVNSAMTVKIQALLDQHHASVGAIDGGWGNNSKNALANFQRMKNLPATGKMNQETWDALSVGADDVLVSYTITKDDITKFGKLPSSVEARSKLSDLGYESIQEKLAERFHMRIDYLTKINPNKKFVAGESITVVNTKDAFEGGFDKIIANTATNTVTAYQGDTLMASYPATIGNSKKPVEKGVYSLNSKVKMPHYRATVTKGDSKQTFILPPGANSPVGVVWMSLDKAGYGIHGVSNPEIIGQPAPIGSIGLSNWDVLELYANVQEGVTVDIK